MINKMHITEDVINEENRNKILLCSSEVDVCHRCAEMAAVTLNMIARHTQQCEKCNGSITRDITEYENSSIIKRIKITIDCDYSKKKQEK